jgi:hypothetical protein
MNIQKQMYSLLALMCLVVPGAMAYDIVIEPVNVDLRVYPGSIRAIFDTNKCVWSGEILREELPVPEWTPERKQKIKQYVDDHFQLWVDGKRLDGQVGKVRYVQGFWQPYSLYARLVFEITYPVSGPSADTLKGHSVFFQEDWTAEKKEAEAAHQAVDSHEYETHLHVHGRSPGSLTLTMDKPDFEIPLATIREHSWQAYTDALWNRVTGDLSGVVLALVLAGIIFRYKDHFY